MRSYASCALPLLILAGCVADGSDSGAATATSQIAPGAADSSEARQGEQVERICFSRNINNFVFAPDIGNAVLLENRVNDWYRVELREACTFSRLRGSRSVAIDNLGSGSNCVTRGDRLVFADTLSPRDRQGLVRCVVGDIYRWSQSPIRE